MFAELFPEEFTAKNMTQTEEPAMTESNAIETEEVQTFPNVNTFTVKFEELGTEYFCAFHPVMYGTVTVN